MKRAFLDIFLSTVAVLFSLFLAHFMMKQNGLSRVVPDPVVGWWTNHLILSQELTPDFGLERFAQLNLHAKKWKLNIKAVPQISILTDDEAGLKFVETTLRSDPNGNFIINILANKRLIDKKVISVIDQEKAESRVIIRSPYDNVVREIGRQEPKWNIGNGEGEVSRLTIMSSLELGAFPPLTGGFFFLNLSRHPHDLSARLLTELRRRQLVIIVETNNDPASWQKALSEGVNGIVMPAAEEFLAWYKGLL
ncbi:MAG: hypothetical protein A4S09_01760 [Proteobacteria bacterium SG_bin7]|nr:MAG: hypothetical protein A4S09_01760 [Proteobacteria bacterium SG_bin7]